MISVLLLLLLSVQVLFLVKASDNYEKLEVNENISSHLTCMAQLPDLKANLSLFSKTDWRSRNSIGGLDYWIRLCDVVQQTQCQRDGMGTSLMVCGQNASQTAVSRVLYYIDSPGCFSSAAGVWSGDELNGYTCTMFGGSRNCGVKNMVEFRFECGSYDPDQYFDAVFDPSTCDYNFTFKSCDVCTNPSTCSNTPISPSQVVLYNAGSSQCSNAGVSKLSIPNDGTCQRGDTTGSSSLLCKGGQANLKLFADPYCQSLMLWGNGTGDGSSCISMYMTASPPLLAFDAQIKC